MPPQPLRPAAAINSGNSLALQAESATHRPSSVSVRRKHRATEPDMIPTLYRSRPVSLESAGSANGPQRAVASRRLKEWIGGVPTTFSLASAVKSGYIDRMPASHGRRLFQITSLPCPTPAVPPTVLENPAPNQALQRTPGRTSFPSAEPAPRRL